MADSIAYRWVTVGFPVSGLKKWGPCKPDKRGNVNLPGGGFAATGSGIPAGQYEARVQSFGNVTFGGKLGDTPSLRFPQVTITVDDKDGLISGIVGSGENIVRSPMTVNAAYVQGGVLVNGWNHSYVLSSPPSSADADKMLWSLTGQADDTAFNQEIVFHIREADFPNAPNQVLFHKLPVHRAHHVVATTTQPVQGIAAPIIYGLHDSAGVSNTGACPVIHVDNVKFYGLVSWGRVTVKRVYKAGVRQAFPAAAVDVAYPIIGGQLYTVLAFSADQSANQWTCDVQGYDSVGDGSGTALNAPGECMLHFLRNVVCFGTTPPVRGMWNTSGGNIQAADFTLAGLSKRAGGWGYKVSKHIASQTSGLAELNAWAADNQLYPVLRPDGNLGVQFHDPSLGAITWNDGDASHWLRYSDREFAALGYDWDQRPVSRVIVAPAALATGGNPTSPLTVDNPLSKSSAVENLSQPWGPAFG